MATSMTWGEAVADLAVLAVLAALNSLPLVALDIGIRAFVKPSVR